MNVLAAPNGAHVPGTRWPSGSLALLLMLLAAAHAGGTLRLVYPVAALLIGIHLQTTSTPAYVRFVLWLWVLSPLIRRIADYQAGWQDPSFVLLTPYIVTASSAAILLARAVFLPTRPLVVPRDRYIFVLAGVGTACGIPLGFASAPSTATLETLNWLVPLAFGWYIATRSEELPQIERAVVSTFGWIAVVVGAYGIYQFLAIPIWDADWMRNSQLPTIGFPEPYAVRLFSTMHSPGVLGFFMLVPPVLWFARPRTAGMPAASLAGIVLLLSQVRSAWLGFCVGAILAVLSLRPISRMRIVVLALLAGLCAAPFIKLPDVWDVTSSRMDTLTQPADDLSAVSRLKGHALAFEFAGTQPLGAGIGMSTPQIEDFVGMRDSVIIASLVQFGVVGACLYFLALISICTRLFGYYWSGDRPEAIGLASAGIALIAIAGLGAVTAGPQGVVFWLIGGLALASRTRSSCTTSSTRVCHIRANAVGASPGV